MDHKLKREQEKETVFPRQFYLQLSDEDVKSLFEKAGRVSLTVEELLENFVADLVVGEKSNGSDERMYAESWFERCWFSFEEYDSFLAYLLKNYSYEDFTSNQNLISVCESELEDLDISEFESESDYAEELEYIKRRKTEAEEEIQKLYEDYCKCSGSHKEYQQEISKIADYGENLKKALSPKNRKDGTR